MFDILREKHAPIVVLIPLLVASSYLGLVLRFTAQQNDGYIGALLDDTWIHIHFADNIAQGNGLAYNDGVVTPGATSPLWVLMLGGVFALTDPGINPQVHIAIGLSALGNLLTVAAITGFGWWVSQRAWVGLLAGVITALTGRFIWMGLSGMEVTTFAALAILALWSHTHDMRIRRVFGWRTGILAALATLARPEGYLLAFLIGLDSLIITPLHERDFKSIRQGWRGIVAYGLLAGSYPLATLMMTGHLLPNTFRVKSQLGKEWPDLPYAYFWTPRMDHGWLLILLAGLGIGWLLWRNWTGRDRTGFAWPIWPIVFVIAVLYLGALHFVLNNGRYVAPAIPFHALAAAIGIWALTEIISRPLIQRTAPAALGVILVISVFWMGRNQGAAVANDVGQLYKMHITAAYWFKQYTRPDAVLALNDVGAIPHIADREVLDMIGLVSPEVIDPLSEAPRLSAPHDFQLARLMLDNPPRFIAIFPWFFPYMVEWEGALQAETQFDIQGPTVIAGGSMVVYQPIWQNWPVQRAVAATATPVESDFEQGIRLAGYEVNTEGSSVTVTLWWRPEAVPDYDLTVFVHLIDEDGQIIAQSDSRPQGGQFNTLWWRPGDIIPDRHTIETDDFERVAGLRVGMYITGDVTRLARVAAPMDQPDYTLLPRADW